MLLWQSYLDRRFFIHFNFTLFNENYYISDVNLNCFQHFSVLLFIVILFDQFWSFAQVWKNEEIQDGESKMAAVLVSDVITSCDVMSSCCGTQRKHFEHRFVVIALSLINIRVKKSHRRLKSPL